MSEKCAGLRFEKEVENLSDVFSVGERVCVLIGGVKEDKLKYVEPLSKQAWKVLVGGKLPGYIDKSGSDERFKLEEKGNVIISRLNPDGEDITLFSVEKFEEAIEEASVVVVSGPMGKYENEGQRLGTRRVLTKVAESGAKKIAGGGDTARVLETLSLIEKFDWVSVGGGAFLDFLSFGTLPAIEALLS
jgi:phosphoglycerate kinase